MRRTTTGDEEAASEQSHSGMPAEHALLGLLALSNDGTGHGYELARQFGPDAPLGNVIRIEPGMVYHHLKKLERLGWVESVPGAVGRPARRPIALSQSGRIELNRWLGEPVAHTREIRLDFLVKLHFALLLDPRVAVRLVSEQREICQRIIESLTERWKSDHADGPPSPAHRFGDLVLEMRLAQTEAALAWLDRVGPEAGLAMNASESASESV